MNKIYIFYAFMTKYILKQGLQTFVKKEKYSITKELTYIYDMTTFIPIYP